jgi:hypothetical protein
MAAGATLRLSTGDGDWAVELAKTTSSYYWGLGVFSPGGPGNTAASIAWDRIAATNTDAHGRLAFQAFAPSSQVTVFSAANFTSGFTCQLMIADWTSRRILRFVVEANGNISSAIGHIMGGVVGG